MDNYIYIKPSLIITCRGIIAIGPENAASADGDDKYDQVDESDESEAVVAAAVAAAAAVRPALATSGGRTDHVLWQHPQATHTSVKEPQELQLPRVLSGFQMQRDPNQSPLQAVTEYLVLHC